MASSGQQACAQTTSIDSLIDQACRAGTSFSRTVFECTGVLDRAVARVQARLHEALAIVLRTQERTRWETVSSPQLGGCHIVELQSLQGVARHTRSVRRHPPECAATCLVGARAKVLVHKPQIALQMVPWQKDRCVLPARGTHDVLAGGTPACRS